MEPPWVAARTEHKHQLRSRIASAARELVAEQGMAAASMGAIAKRVGVSRATVYNYFPDVEEALLHAVAEEVDRFTATVEQELAGDPVHRLRAYVGVQVRYFADRRTAALHFKLAGLSPLIRDRMREHTARLEQLLVDILTDGRNSGQFRSNLDPRRGAELVLHLLAGIREQVVRADVPVESLVDEAVALNEHGMRGTAAGQ